MENDTVERQGQFPRVPQALAGDGSARTAIRRILVVVDPTAGPHPCIEKALRIACITRSTVELYACDAELDLPESWAGESRVAEYREIKRQRCLEDLERLAAPLRGAGINVETVCERIPPLEEGIGRHIIRSQPDLVIKDAHRRPVLPRNSAAPADWNLICHSPAPLLLVQGQSWSSQPSIVLAVGASRDAAMTGMSLALQEALAASLQLLHVFATPPHLPDEPVTWNQRLHAQVEARAVVTALALESGIRPSQLYFTSGSPVSSITDFATAHKTSLLVVGALSRTRFVHSPEAITAVQLLQQLGCDLLVMKPAGFISPLLVTDD